MTNEFLNGYQAGEHANNIMLIKLGVRDLAEMKIRKDSNMILGAFKQDQIIKELISSDLRWKIIDINETFKGLYIWKHEIIGQIVERLDSIKDPVLLSYLNGKLFGYATSEIIISDH